jgi:hypothetical protein
MSDDQDPQHDGKGEDPPLSAEVFRKGHEPPTVSPQGESADVAAGHAPAETRGHEAPEGRLELGHPPPEQGIVVQQIGEMHSPADEAPPPTAAPPKPADSAQSVTPPQAREETPSQTPGDTGDQR